eukprot:TRINITY_DN9061_c1_g2_i1.p2 TRINITY_DN9061_c1_g2~~TRINITY_DN9061_c1_g2_i1.p2  ORF type:complete len:548 (+),score=234.18 TRINITY_DN9061_c1_g2_i1:77-1720(+)
MRSLLLLLGLAGAASASARAERPNIVFFLTDDQDQMLGASFPTLDGVTPMPYTEKEFSGKGNTATNFFIHTPICCPSRAEMLTGRYFHNVKRDHAHANCPSTHDIKGPNCCMHVDTDLVNNQTFGKPLQAAGYTTGYFGKYLNLAPKWQDSPVGWDSYMGNNGGHYFGANFQVHGVEGYDNGQYVTSIDTYNTAFISNVTLNWIEQKVAKKQEPFFAVFGFKAAHEPFSPAPWYADHWDPAWPAHEPRPVSWNCSTASRAHHHESIATNPDIITEGAAEYITAAYKNRWRTLMSVDDAIKGTFELSDKLGITDRTYFFYSSDHGFQLGEFNILIDKRNVYDHNTRIHLLSKGPGIKAGSEFSALASQVDLVATFLDLAGLDPTTTGGDKPVDGKSLLPFLFADESLWGEAPASVQASLRKIEGKAGSLAGARDGWRDSMFIEYYYNANNSKYIPYEGVPYKTEDESNSYIAIRHVGHPTFGNTLYAEFQYDIGGEPSFDAIDFHEYYDIDADPWQMHNKYSGADPKVIDQLHAKLRQWFTCSGESCK